MNEWLIKNTTINQEKYDTIINSDTIHIAGLSKEKNEEQVDNMFEHPMLPIKKFTYKKPNFCSKTIYKVKGNKEMYIHKDIKFQILAQYIKSFESEYIDIKRLIKFLWSKHKIGKCFTLSIDISALFDNSRVIVAICNDFVYKNTVPFLHAFVIIEKDGKEYVVDGSLNIVMEKEIYFNLLKVNVLNEIPNKRAIRDTHYIKNTEVAKYIMYADYLCFPDEIMQGVKPYIKDLSK